MTLIAGLMCKDVIVFAADSEQSGFIRKSSVDKISATPHTAADILSGRARCPLIVAGAGHGTLADYATQRIISEVGCLATLSEVERKIAEILREIFSINVPLHPVARPQDAAFELLIGVKPEDVSTPILFSTEGVTVVRRPKYFVCGSGALVDYILDQIYTSDMPQEDGISAALFMLQVAKQYVDGVSGESHITVLKSDGSILNKPPWETSEEEVLSKRYSNRSGRLLLSCLRTRTGSDKEFESALKEFNEEVREFRKLKKESDKRIEQLLALWKEQQAAAQATQSTSETSEPVT